MKNRKKVVAAVRLYGAKNGQKIGDRVEGSNEETKRKLKEITIGRPFEPLKP